jgi:hypothetical protein
VYIGRPSRWGNPFSWKDGTLAEHKVASDVEAVAAFEAWFTSQPELVEDAKRELCGKVLGCWCSPKPCHGDVIARIVNADDET